MKLIETKKGLVIQTKYGDITIHINHTHDTLEDFQDDIRQHHWWSPYMVAEECTNHARVHLVYASSKIHALEQVDEYLREKEGIAKGIKFIFVNNIKIVEETHLITAEELDFDLKAKPR